MSDHANRENRREDSNSRSKKSGKKDKKDKKDVKSSSKKDRKTKGESAAPFSLAALFGGSGSGSGSGRTRVATSEERSNSSFQPPAVIMSALGSIALLQGTTMTSKVALGVIGAIALMVVSETVLLLYFATFV
jgi:hypothetical protein